MTHFCIVCTGWNNWPWIRDTVASIDMQEHRDFDVCITDDASHDDRLTRYIPETCHERGWRWILQSENRGTLYNQVAAIRAMEPGPEDVIVFLDPDGDRFAHPQVLTRLAEAYADGTRVAYSKYECDPPSATSTQSVPHPPEVIANNSYRAHTLAHGMCWNHLRSFRADVFLAIDEAQFKDDAGEWFRTSADTALMTPCLELAGTRVKCQPPGTLVTVVETRASGSRRVVTRDVPIEDLKIGDLVVSYNQPKAWLRRQGSQVTHISRHHVADRMAVVHCGEHITRMTPGHICIVRLGNSWFNKWFIYLMRRGNDFRIGMVRGRHRSDNGGFGLRKRAWIQGADAAWILSAHDTDHDARIAEQLVSHEYHLPQLMFKPSRYHGGMSQEELDVIWAKIGDNEVLARTALEAHGRMLEYPLVERTSDQYMIRACQTVRACNLLDGMEMLPLSGAARTRTPDGGMTTRQVWSPFTVTWEYYEGPVYGLAVEDDASYVADGLVTHNCIDEVLLIYRADYELSDWRRRPAEIARDHLVILNRPPLSPLP